MFYINGRFLTQKITGVNRFALEICKELKKAKIAFKIIVPTWLEIQLEWDFDFVRYGSLKSHFWEQISLQLFLLNQKKPLLISFSGLGPVLYRNQVITIHDLSFLRNPSWFSRSYYLFYKTFLPIIVKKAKKILTVSEFSKKEIELLLRVPDYKIVIVPNAVSMEIFRPTDDTSNDLQKYILAVSSLDPRKNHIRLIEAFEKIDLPDHSLYIVGKSHKHFNFKGSNAEKKNIIFLGYVSDVKLAKLYKQASIFVYPSLYEGFGIPPLEAMANGCPVIASDIPSLKEVCKDAALYVDPYSVDDIGRAILNLMENAHLRANLIERGLQNSKSYSWSKSASIVLSVITELNK